MAGTTKIIPVKLQDGRVVLVEATAQASEEDVAFQALSFEGVTDAIESIAEAVVGSLGKVKPTKGSVEFGIEVAIEAGALTALIAKGSGTANLKITLEWS